LPRPTVGAHNAHALLAILVAQPEFGGGKETIDDVVVLTGAVVDQFGVAGRSDDEQRRHLALPDPRRKLDIDLVAIVEGAQRPPRRAVAFDRIAEVEFRDIDARCDRLHERGLCILPPQRKSWSCGYCHDTEAM
jgi:hypothetical protein